MKKPPNLPCVWAGDRYTVLSGDAVDDPANYPPIEHFIKTLSRVPRFGGWTTRPYVVAMHLLTTVHIALCRNKGKLPDTELAELALAALTHDLHEAITGDMPTPVKAVLGDSWHSFEDRVEHAVLKKFGLHELNQRHAAEVKACDLIALEMEKRAVLPQAVQAAVWEITRGVKVLPEFEVYGHSPAQAEEDLLSCWNLFNALREHGAEHVGRLLDGGWEP